MVLNERRKLRQHTLEFKRECVDLYLTGLSSRDIGKKHDISHSLVQRWVKSEGFELRSQKETVNRCDPHTKTACINQYLLGKSAQSVANIYGVDAGSVLNWLKESNLQIRHRGIRKISDEIKSISVERYLSGEHSTDLSEEIGVSSSTILRWVCDSGHKTRPRGTTTELICDYCGEHIVKYTSSIKDQNHFFCDLICSGKYQSEHRIGENSPRWLGGKSFEPYCVKWTDDLKERVREFFERRCVLCSKMESDCNRRLDVHHVEYDKDICCNNKHPYLVPLCQSCHAKTSNIALRDDYAKKLVEFVDINYNGKCFYNKDEYKLLFPNYSYKGPIKSSKDP
jgi:transposase-like protein